jgi:Tol biopolymer transport system component
METKGDLNGAINLFNDIIKKYPKEREYAAKSQLYIGLCYEKLGVAEAQKAYKKVVNSYPEQTETVKLANAKLSLLLRAEAPAKSTEITIRRVWSGPDVMDVQSPSPDGRYLSYTDWETRDLTVHDLVTGENRHVTKNDTKDKPGERSAYPDNSVFSPDGNRIAYCWWIENEDIEDKDFYGEIRTIAPDGSGERVIYRSKENFPSRLDWSTDGKQILTKLNGRPALIAVADGSIQYLPIESPGMMCFAPNGSYIAFDARPSKEARQSDVYVYDRTTQRTSLLVCHPANDRLAGWSPDGRYVLFASDRRSSQDAWLIAVSGGQPQGEPILVRSNLGEHSEALGFTKSGAFIFSGGTGGRDVFSAKLDIQKGKLLSNPEEAAGSNLGSNWGPDFSRDGKSLAYVTGQGGIAIQSLETTDKKTIKPDYEIRRAGRMYGLRWAPDGRSFVVTGVDRQGRESLLRINSLTGEANVLLNAVCGDTPPPFDLSPDGNKIFYLGRPTGGSVHVWDLESGKERQLDSVNAWSLAVSPDGEQLAFFGSFGKPEPGGLFIMPSTGGSPRLLVEVKERRGAVAWTPDGSQLLYAVSSKSSDDAKKATLRYELWRVSSKGGEPQKLGLMANGMIMSLRVHPDGQRIVYGRSWSSPEIWVMENFLPKEKTQPNNQLTLKKLENDILNTPYARLSPDGKKIAYQVSAGGSPKRFDMLDLNSGTTKVLLDGTVGDPSYLTWSPQSDKIAYTFQHKELIIRDLNGTNSQVILKNPIYKIYSFDWSRDGKKILCFFEGDDRLVSIGTVTLDGKMQILKSSTGSNSGFVSEPRISPDGRYIACSLGERGGNTDIYVWTADDSRKVQVTAHPGRDESPVWSPDGKYLVFLSDQNRSTDLWGVQMKNGETVGAPFMIKQDLGWRTEIKDLTASGKLFLFMLGGAEPANLYTIPVDQESGNLNGTITPISFYPTAHSFPRYSPDGKMIAFLSRRGQVGMPKLYVVDEKGVEKELPLQGYYATNIAWHPENGSVIFTGWDKTNKSGVFEVSLDKGELRPIFTGETFDMKTLKGAMVNINLLPDAGKIMFFRFLDKQNVEVLTCHPDGQQSAVVLPKVKMPLWGFPSPTGENICYRLGDSLMVVSVPDGSTKLVGSSTLNLEATWSPNGENLMFREGSSLRVYSVKEKATRTLYQAPAGKTIGGMEMYANIWSPDGNRVIITEQDTSAISASPQKLILVNPADGSFRLLGEAPKGYRLKELRWSPDGSRVMATGNSIRNVPASTYEYWVLENFLPK